MMDIFFFFKRTMMMCDTDDVIYDDVRRYG